MSNLHADHYADAMVQIEAPLERNERIAEDSYRMRVAAPAIAETCAPGQFVMIRLSGRDAPLIGRALAVYEVGLDGQGDATWLDLVYLRKGTFTQALAAAPCGTLLSLWGPLGNRFRGDRCDRLIMAAGGIGQTPMLMLGQEASGVRQYGTGRRRRDPDQGGANLSGWSRSVELIYGARRASLLAGVDDFRAAGLDVTLCTDDGSAGVRARVPDLLATRLAEVSPEERVRVVTCGPEVMMEKVAEASAAAGVDCQVSMETPMACGVGICFTCVAKVRDAGEETWDYKRTCVEGPIFDAPRICW